MKYIYCGIAEDKRCTPFVKWTYLPTGITYVDFPFFEETVYQKSCFYDDDLPLEFNEFAKMTHGKYK